MPDAASLGDASALDATEITTADAMEALADEWGALWERCPSASPFQTPEWLLAWWRHFGGSGELHTLSLRRGGALVGLAPLYVPRDDRARGQCRLAFVGLGVSDYLDVLLQPDAVADGRAAILSYAATFVERRGTRVELEELRAGSPLLAGAMPPSVTGVSCERQSTCPVLRLPTSWDAYLAGLSQGRRRKLRVAERRLAEAGEVRVARADASTVGAFLDALCVLHEARWRDRRQPGVLADPAIRAFHHDATRGLVHRGVLRLLCLSVGGAPAAVLYAFARGDRWYNYLDGFDPARADMSPGTVLVAHAMQQAIADGQRDFDFLRGRESYKYAWGATDEPTYRLCISPAVADSSRPAPELSAPAAAAAPPS